MNEFNPFEALGIDPNKEIQTSWPTLRVDNDSNQFNPFTTLWINPNETQIDQTWIQIYDNPKDNEVSSKLGVDLNRLSDQEKQSYVNALSDENWNIWNNLKNEWYSFEARKALLENRESLYDINKAWTQKYFTEYVPVEDKYDVAQNMVNWYQNRAQWFWDRMEENISEFLNYKNKGTERGWYPWKKIANLVNHVVSKWAQIIDDAMNIWMQAMEVRSAIDVARWKTDKIVNFDENAENYKSVFASSVWLATWIGEATLMAVAPYVYWAFWILWQGDWPVAKLINWLAIPFELGAEWIVDLALTNDKFQEYLNRPENAWAEEELKEWVSLALMAIVWKYLKSRNEAWWKTRMWRFYTETKTKIGNAIKQGAEYAKGTRKMMETDPRFSETPELVKTQNVIKATWRWLKEWRNKDIRLEETPTETVSKEEVIESKEITPYEQERQRQIQQRKTDIVNQTKDLKISDESKNNLSNNPDLQTAYTEVLKPYLQENWINNTQGVINQQIDDLVYDIIAWIDELYTQQANLTRTVWWTQKISKFEKELIKEIKKIIANKEPKTVIKKLSKLTPAQQWIMEKILPDLNRRITTINQLDKLVQEINKNNLVWKILKFQAERPRFWIRWAIKQKVYQYISDSWNQKGIQHTIEDIDNFVNKLSEAELNDIAKGWEQLSKSPLATKIEEWWKALWVRRAESGEIDQYKIDQLKDEWYMPETNLYTTDEAWKMVEHDILNELDTKPANWWKTIREIFKEAWVNLTLPNKRIYDIRFSRWRNVAWIYYDGIDLIALPRQSEQVWVLMHEFGHRLRKQFGEDQMLKITDAIEKNTGLTNKEANERFAEYMRNYFLYGNIDWKLSKDMIKDMWKDLWQKVFNQMEKTRNELLDVFWAPNNRYITETIDSVLKLTEKGERLVKKEIQWKPQELQDFLQKNISTLEQYSESPLKISWNNIIKQLKEQAFADIKKIRIDEEWNVMGQYHSHEGPIALLMENREEIKLDKEVKTLLEKQAEERENKKLEQSLKNLTE